MYPRSILYKVIANDCSHVTARIVGSRPVSFGSEIGMPMKFRAMMNDTALL